MIRLTKKLFIGNSDDAYSVKLGGLLNVACDLYLYDQRDWQKSIDVEYTHVGLINGPGNEVSDYCAAVFSLAGLVRRHDTVTVYDHDGGMALVVAAMYLNLVEGQHRPDPLSWSHWLTWEERISLIKMEMKATNKGLLHLPVPHNAHKVMFAKIPFGVLEVLL